MLGAESLAISHVRKRSDSEATRLRRHRSRMLRHGDLGWKHRIVVQHRQPPDLVKRYPIGHSAEYHAGDTVAIHILRLHDIVAGPNSRDGCALYFRRRTSLAILTIG